MNFILFWNKELLFNYPVVSSSNNSSKKKYTFLKIVLFPLLNLFFSIDLMSVAFLLETLINYWADYRTEPLQFFHIIKLNHKSTIDLSAILIHWTDPSYPDRLI